MNKFHEIEIAKLYETVLSIENFRLQSGIFFATINLGVLSFAATQEKSVFFFFGAILFWIMIPIDYSGRKGLTACYYRIAYLHKKYVKNDKEFSPKRFSVVAQETQRVLNLPEGHDKNATLRSIPWRTRNLLGFWLPIGASLIEIILGILLWQFMGWSLI